MSMIINSYISTLWTPAELSTVVWYDASDLTTIDETGGLVSQLDDKSGNNNHATQATPGDKPSTGVNSLGGLNTIKFDLDCLQSVAPTANNINAVFFVTNNLAEGTNNTIAPIFSDNIGLNVANDDDYTFVRINDNQYDISLDGSTMTEGVCSNNGGPLFSNGSPDFRNITMGMSIAEKGTSTGNVFYTQYDSNPIEIQKIGSVNGNLFLVGDIAEIIALDVVPSLALRQIIEGYLAWKWGTVAKLPVGHPYKLFAPIK